MRYLYLNNELCDIDDKTIIGFDIQSYDVKDPAQPRVVISNNFTIPLTAKNKRIIGFAGNKYSDYTTIYSKFEVLYIVNNDVIAENARARVEKVKDRIELFIFQKDDIWDTFKKTKLNEITDDLIEYLASKYNYPTESNKWSGTLENFCDLFLYKRGLYLSYYFGNLSQYRDAEGDPYYEFPDEIFLKSINRQGGHLSLWMVDFIKFLEYKYGIDFQSEEIFDGNIFLDEYVSKSYVPFQHICINSYYTELFVSSATSNNTWDPTDVIIPKSEKSIYDLLIAFFKHFNILIDYFWKDGAYVTRLYRFDDIATKAPIINWSGKIDGTPEFKPIIKGYSQKTYIQFNKTYEGADPFINSKLIEVSNDNIDTESTITKINAYINAFAKSLSDRAVPLLDTPDALNEFSFFVDSDYESDVTVKLDEDSCVVRLAIPSLYSLDNEYLLLAGMMQYPKMYTIERWMTLSDIRNILFFAQYFIEELGGSFFINKISGFNPVNKLTTTKIELIKIGDAAPRKDVDGNYWVDGVENRFVDGVGNNFIW